MSLLKPILFRTSSGFEVKESLGDLEERIYNIVVQEKGEENISLNPSYISSDFPSHEDLGRVEFYIGVFPNTIRNLDNLCNLENEVYRSKFYGNTNHLFIIPSIKKVRGILPDRIGNAVFASLFSDKNDDVIEYGDDFMDVHEQRAREFLQRK